MSRVGKLPIAVPENVTISLDGLNIKINGPKGSLEKTFIGPVSFLLKDNELKVTPNDSSKYARSMWGTARSIINSMVMGVQKEFVQELEIKGVGYRAVLNKGYLDLTLGKSHSTKIFIPSGITIEVPKQDVVIIKSINKQVLGQFTASIVKQRPPEPYKGKGIIKKGQYIQRKESKKT
ncbi:MAG: 50S ribosomal protein L6 [Rickettsiaceae bacterium]